jgi:phage baseplate assembly protein W
MDDNEKNFLFKSNQITKDALRSNLYLLLLTDKGERYYMPDYGINLKKFFFEQKDENTLQLIQEDFKNTIKKYIPQLTINNIQFYTLTDEDGNPIKENEVRIQVNFTYSDDVFQENDEITLTVTT